MLVAAAVCPHPPLLVPAVGVGLGPDIAALRTQCQEAVDAVIGAGADRVYIVGAGLGSSARSFAPWAPGSFEAGIDVDVPEPMPLPLLVGAFLTRGRPRSFVVVDVTTGPDDCLELGRELAATAARVGLVVMGDGAARHDVKAPGYLDPRSADWDQSVHAIFRSGELSKLGSLDPVVGEELLCAGRAPWQVLAGATTDVAVHTGSATLSVPFGVGYHVAHWTTAAGHRTAVAKG